MKNNKTLIAIVAVVAFVLMFAISTYNSFVSLDLQATEQWAQVENQYQRRFDLIPNLVKSVEGVMKQEKDVFGALAEARTRYSGATSVSDKAQAAGQLESALSRLLVVMENYPVLKSDQTVNRLMDELAGTENRIATERGRFNNTVKDFNLKVRTFPGNLLAGIFGFSPKNYFEAAEVVKTAPQVEFNTD